ncbi:Succinate dehydrogenase assembly factor 2 mitochondrial [Zalerion maritima]|uniref:Succinate dehydrogenase assembly factor 2, mitochondrial n=1 Tax=Zalerion maritima TaxID=339359 RepID=A0AAD5WMA3_9PEZI|nr:Succinate dehydrogenase assembly factor 2 mitochondrial [Zalerion maritima]
MASISRFIRPVVRQGFAPFRPLSTTTRNLNAGGKELGVGEMEGIEYKVQPLKRTGEDESILRARLQYQSRKRGMREGELLLSTFAASNLQGMGVSEMQEYDKLLDENDWDIYYWATQNENEPPQGKEELGFEPKPAPGEWAQTVGAFRPAYRPVPSRWQGSPILLKLREHVEKQKTLPQAEGKPGGMAFVPDLPSREP